MADGIKIFVRPLGWKDKQCIAVTLPSGSIGQDLKGTIGKTLTAFSMESSNWIPIETIGTAALGMDGQEYIKGKIDNQDKMDEFNGKILVVATKGSSCLSIAIYHYSPLFALFVMSVVSHYIAYYFL